VTIQVQEVDDIPEHGRSVNASFMGTVGDKVASEAARFLHLLELRVNDTRAISMGEGGGATWPGTMVILPFVEVMSVELMI